MANIADINAECRLLCDADTTSYPAAALLRRINESYERRVGQIIGADGLWQFDDSNYTDRSIATTTLVAAQRDYSFNSTQLEIEKVEVKDSGGNWQSLSPIDKSQYGEPLEELYKNDGLPEKYDKEGNSILLYPAAATASVTLVAGLKIYFKRSADLFTAAQVTTGTKTPGFASFFHMILAYDAAIPFCMAYRKDRVAYLVVEAKRLEIEMIKHYSRREADRRKALGMAGVSSR